MSVNTFILSVGILVGVVGYVSPSIAKDQPSHPNVIFVVADDMGWRDTGFSGNPVVQTPHLDDMAQNSLWFDNFFSAHATCSPGRMAILTGRTPLRARMVTTVGPMQEGEVTVAQALKTAGYKTAHFGKWGLGREGTHPLKVGFDDAIWTKGHYNNGVSLFVGQSDKEDLKPVTTAGESSVAVMDIAIEYMRKQAANKQAFFAQICFGSPHGPHLPHEDYKKLYAKHPEDQNYYGEISGLDAAVGNLRKELREMNIAENTILWFVSDNGGIREGSGGKLKGKIGVRTTGLLEWPSMIRQARRTNIPVGHQDMYPTILDIVGVTLPNQPIVDGTSIHALIQGTMKTRPKPLGFIQGGHADKSTPKILVVNNRVWIDGRYKLRIQLAKKTRTESVSLYDVFTDPTEQTDIAEQHPEVVKRLITAMKPWQESVADSFAGKDYIKN